MPRKNHNFYAPKVWRLVKANPGITQKGLREILGWDSNRAACMLRNLKDKGFVRHDGAHQVNTRWYAVGEKPPENRRGCNPNSQIGLSVGRENWRAGLKLAFEARGWDPEKIGKGPTRTYAPRPFAECALAECWTLPDSRTKKAA